MLTEARTAHRDAADEARYGRSWVDARHRGLGQAAPAQRGRGVDRVLQLDPAAVRRQGAALDRERFDRVPAADASSPPPLTFTPPGARRSAADRRRQAGGVARTTQTVEVEGRRLTLSNLEKVLYPATGTTKGEVIDYYTRIAPVMLPHLAGRPVTRKRWPDGVGRSRQPFFEKNAPARHAGLGADRRAADRPARPGPRDDRLPADRRCWPTWSTSPTSRPRAARAPVAVQPRAAARDADRLVLDLDPGPAAGLEECAQVALAGAATMLAARRAGAASR